MRLPRFLAIAWGAVALAAALGTAAQGFPNRPITIIVPFPPGGVTDPVARLVGQRISESTGQTVLVDNRPGGGGVIGAEIVKRAPADGYTIFFGHFGTHTVNPSLYTKLPYDPVKDFAPITTLISTESILVVPAASAAKSPADLVAMSRAQSGGLTFASQGVGSGGHLLGEMFKSQAGANVAHVAYKGSGPALQDMLAGRVDLFFDALITSGPHVRDGKLRALAITGKQRHRLFPDVPTLTEAGMPGLDLSAWFGMFAPAGTPQPVIRRLHEEFVKAITGSDIMKKYTDQGLDVVTMSPEAFAKLIADDTVRYAKVVKESGARVD
jgi:tripartite-type tricarboxylate transporter receptor subunit TctC